MLIFVGFFHHYVQFCPLVMEFGNKNQLPNCRLPKFIHSYNKLNEGKIPQILACNERPGNSGGIGQLHSTNMVAAKQNPATGGHGSGQVLERIKQSKNLKATGNDNDRIYQYLEQTGWGHCMGC